MIFQKVTIIPWPYSQICMECKHGVLIEGKGVPSSCYACNISVLEHDGTNCQKQEREP